MKALKIAVNVAIAVGVICSAPYAFAASQLSKDELKHAPKGCGYVLKAVPPEDHSTYNGPEPSADVIMCQTWLGAFRGHDANSQSFAKMLEEKGHLRMGLAYWQREAEAASNQ